MAKSSLQNRAADKRTPVFLFLYVLLAADIAFCGLGGLSGAYLRSPVGGTAFAMGGAATASPSNLCSWWNPASLSLLKSKTLILGTGYRTLGRTDGFVAWEQRVPPRVGLGLSMLYRGDPFLKNLYDEQEYRLEDGSYTTLSFKIGLSYIISRKVSAGLNLGVYYQRLPASYEDGSLIYSSSTAMGGFDLAVRYEPLKNLAFGLVIKNLSLSFARKNGRLQWKTIGSDWEIKLQREGLNITVEENFPPTITLGSEFRTSLLGKPFIWDCDLAAYLFEGNFEPIGRVQAVINNGFEWQRWEIFFIRAGLREIVLNSRMFNDRHVYRDQFNLAVTAGFYLDLSSALKGLKLNYGISTSRLWTGVEQQLDFIYTF